jgi:long-subunit fatty acid transport protein
VNKLFLTAILIITGFSCSKNNNRETDRVLPVVAISAPLNNQVFAAGQPVNITGTLSDNQQLAEVHVHISNTTTGTLLVDIHRYPLSATYTLNESFSVQSGIEYKIQVIAKDNAANENRATLLVSAN